MNYLNFFFNNSQAIEPRLGLRYAFKSGASINFGAGIHHQIQPLPVYFVETQLANGQFDRTNEDLGFTRSDQLVLGYEMPLGRNMRFKIESYYQDLNNIPVESRISSESLINAGADFGIPDYDSLVNKGNGTECRIGINA